VSAILLLDGVMIIIFYRSPTITTSLSQAFGHNSQCKRQLVAPPGIRNISPMKLSYSTFSVKFFQIFVTMATGVGLRQISLTQLNSPTPKPPAWCKNQEDTIGRLRDQHRLLSATILKNRPRSIQ